MICPGCDRPLGGLASYCPDCGDYVDLLGSTKEADPPTKVAGPSEAEISAAVAELLRHHGFAVWSTEQGYRKERGGTRQTPGIPDLIVMGYERLLFVEMKSRRGRLRRSQKAFRDECRANGVEWALWRSVGEAQDWVEIVLEAVG